MKPKLIIKSLEDLFGIVILIENPDDKEFLTNLLSVYGVRVGWGNGLSIFNSGIEAHDKWVLHTKLGEDTFDTPRVFSTDRTPDISFKNLDFQIEDRQTDSSMIMNLFQ